MRLHHLMAFQQMISSSSAWEHQSASWRQSSPARRLIPCSALEQCSSREECRCAAGIVPASAAHRRSHAAPPGNRGQVQGGAQAPVTTRELANNKNNCTGRPQQYPSLHGGVSRSMLIVTNKRGVSAPWQGKEGPCPLAWQRG